MIPVNAMMNLSKVLEANDENFYSVVLFGDGSGHFQDGNDTRTVGFNSWADLANVSTDAHFNKFKKGVKAVIKGSVFDKYVGVVAEVDKSTANDKMVRLLSSSFEDGWYWEFSKNLEVYVPSQFAVKDDVVVVCPRSVHDKDRGIILAVIEGGYKVWVECDQIITIEGRYLTKG